MESERQTGGYRAIKEERESGNGRIEKRRREREKRWSIGGRMRQNGGGVGVCSRGGKVYLVFPWHI